MKLLKRKIQVKKPINSKLLKNSCLDCHGDLRSYIKTQYLAILNKSVLPVSKGEVTYVCDDCETSFSPSIKYLSLLNDEERNTQVNTADDIYARLMVASLVYTALVDGKFSLKEEELLEKVVDEAKDFPSTEAVLERVFELQAEAKEYVFSVFKFAKEHISAARLESVVIANARMVLVDGKVQKAERKLLKSYLKSAGLDVSLEDLLSRAHLEQYNSVSEKFAKK